MSNEPTRSAQHRPGGPDWPEIVVAVLALVGAAVIVVLAF
jgi:hypothetical protein